MNTKPKALRLTDELDAIPENGADPDLISEAAAELRRLHEVNQMLVEALNWCVVEINRDSPAAINGKLALAKAGEQI